MEADTHPCIPPAHPGMSCVPSQAKLRLQLAKGPGWAPCCSSAGGWGCHCSHHRVASAQKLPEVSLPWGQEHHQTWHPACSFTVLPPWRSCLGLGSQVPALHPTEWGCGSCACMKEEDTSFITSSLNPSRELQHPAAQGCRQPGLAWLSHGIPLFDHHQCLIVPDEHLGAPDPCCSPSQPLLPAKPTPSPGSSRSIGGWLRCQGRFQHCVKMF